MDERLNTENLGESKQHIPEKKNEVHKIEMFLGELLAARYGADEGQVLSPLTSVCLVRFLFGLVVGWLAGELVVVVCVSLSDYLEYKRLCSVSVVVWYSGESMGWN